MSKSTPLRWVILTVVQWKLPFDVLEEQRPDVADDLALLQRNVSMELGPIPRGNC